jgi:O-methyltransferase
LKRPRIDQLPSALQPPAKFVRRVIGKSPYTFEGDVIATGHYSPFLEDAAFNGQYAKVAHTWPGWDIRWRLWILTRSAIHCSALDGSFAEFGVYRGGTSFMVLSQCRPHPGRAYFLFDTFAGIPNSNLTARETETGFAGRLSDVTLAEVHNRLLPWSDVTRIAPGDVFETLRREETGPLAFAHLDLNAAAPTEVALEYAWSRMVPGGIVVFDDYGWSGYEDQRAMIDRFFTGKPDGLIALPTGQALSVKL